MQREIDRSGGRIQYGWVLWLWPRVLAQAEHHAVYISPDDGSLRDLTPGPARRVKRRLFLPDDDARVDPDDRSARRDNIRLPLTDDPLIDEVLAGMAARTEVWRSPREAAGSAGAATLATLQAAEFAQHHAELQLARKYARPNDPCFCDSGKRFKLCHGRR